MDRTDWTLVALVFLAGMFAAAQFGKVALTLPDLASAYGRDLTDVAVFVSLVGMVGLLFGAMAGGIAAGVGPGRTFIFGLVLGAALSLLQALSLPFWLFAASRLAEGVAHLALVVGGPPLMAAAASDRARPLVMGIWAVFFGASLALSGVILPPLLAAGGLAAVFLAHGAGLAVLAALLWRRVPRIPRTPVSLAPVAIHREIYGRIAHVAPGLGFVCYTFLFVALIAILPEAMDRPAMATTLPLVTLTTTLAGGALCRRFTPWQVTAAGYLGTGLGLAAAAVGVPGGALVSFAAMGLIPGASFAAIPAWNGDPRGRTRATGAIAQLGNLGTVSGTPVLVAVYARGGTDAVLWAATLAAGLGLLLAVTSGPRAERP